MVDLIPVKPFDVATFVAHGGAQLGIVGADVLYEFGYSEVYSPVDLAIGHCRLSLAGEPDVIAANPVANMSHIKIATKYPNVTKAYFAKQGIQAECIKLNGSIELGPKLVCTPHCRHCHHRQHTEGQWIGGRSRSSHRDKPTNRQSRGPKDQESRDARMD